MAQSDCPFCGAMFDSKHDIAIEAGGARANLKSVHLTPYEIRIVMLLLQQSTTSKELSAITDNSRKCVKVHLSRIRDKLKAIGFTVTSEKEVGYLSVVKWEGDLHGNV
jgi:DNA-binding CsgD family transcriptional regulator